MTPPPNDSTKFEVAWLIFWILLSTVLIVLAALRKLTLPNIIKGDKIFSMIFAFLQLVIFVLFLALLAHDQWSIYKVSSNFGNFWLAYGVTSSKNNNLMATAESIHARTLPIQRSRLTVRLFKLPVPSLLSLV